MKILAIEKEIEGVTPELIRPYLADEARQVWELYKSGIVREIYFCKEDHCAVIILECKGIEEAKEYLSTLPFVKEKLISFELKTLLPYDGFDRILLNNL